MQKKACRITQNTDDYISQRAKNPRILFSLEYFKFPMMFFCPELAFWTVTHIVMFKVSILSIEESHFVAITKHS